MTLMRPILAASRLTCQNLGVRTDRTAVLRAVGDAVLVLAGAGALGVAIVVIGLGLLDDTQYAGGLTEGAYLAVAAAALAAAGSGVLVGACFVRRSVVVRDEAQRAGSPRTDPGR
jgi:hypothetical protein